MKGALPIVGIVILILFLWFLGQRLPGGIYPAIGTLAAGTCVKFEGDIWQLTGTRDSGRGIVDIKNLRTGIITGATNTDEVSFMPTSCEIVAGGFMEDKQRLIDHYAKTKSRFDFPEDCPIIGLAVLKCTSISGTAPAGMSINFAGDGKTISYANYYYAVDASGFRERAGINTGIYINSDKSQQIADWTGGVIVSTPVIVSEGQPQPVPSPAVAIVTAGRIPLISDLADFIRSLIAMVTGQFA